MESESIFDIREVDYELIKKGEIIGSGASGTVFLTTLDENPVAVKKLRVNSINPSELSTFTRELLISSNLKCPHIVNCVGLSLRMPNICIVMEYFPLGDLRRVLIEKGKNLSVGILVKIAFDISMGMLYLHNSKIIHRDLKLDNIMVESLEMEREVNAKVADFGTSCIREQNKLTHSSPIGTIRYLPPEVILENFDSKEKLDVYCFSFVLWEIFARGAVAMRELKSIDQIRNHVQKGGRAGEVSPDCPMSVTNLMKMCWSQKHRDRPSFDYISQSLLTELSSHHFFLSIPSLSSPSPPKYSSPLSLSPLRLNPLHDNLPLPDNSFSSPTPLPYCNHVYNNNNNNNNNTNHCGNNNNSTIGEEDNERKGRERRKGAANRLGNISVSIETEIFEKEPILET